MQRFNGLPAEELRARLLRCVAVPRWADTLVDGRPYADLAALLGAADDLTAGLTDDEIQLALADHPKIGQRTNSAWSRAEQSGVDDREVERFRDANIAYEARFGHIYLVCATGRGGADMLADLTARLTNDPVTETASCASNSARSRRCACDASSRANNVSARHDDGRQAEESMTSAITTHVLDTALGRPAAGVAVRLEQASSDDGWRTLGDAITDADGRIREIGPAHVPAGTYRFTFDTGGYFAKGRPRDLLPRGRRHLLGHRPESHYHVPILLSPFSLSTYRGS